MPWSAAPHQEEEEQQQQQQQQQQQPQKQKEQEEGEWWWEQCSIHVWVTPPAHWFVPLASDESGRGINANNSSQGEANSSSNRRTSHNSTWLKNDLTLILEGPALGNGDVQCVDPLLARTSSSPTPSGTWGIIEQSASGNVPAAASTPGAADMGVGGFDAMTSPCSILFLLLFTAQHPSQHHVPDHQLATADIRHPRGSDRGKNSNRTDTFPSVVSPTPDVTMLNAGAWSDRFCAEPIKAMRAHLPEFLNWGLQFTTQSGRPLVLRTATPVPSGGDHCQRYTNLSVGPSTNLAIMELNRVMRDVAAGKDPTLLVSSPPVFDGWRIESPRYLDNCPYKNRHYTCYYKSHFWSGYVAGGVVGEAIVRGFVYFLLHEL
ncbi:unnamed protein product [Closterium sp. NIES-64]|nr:unnamed protein product [Closterium sp. NIES-64]